MNINGAAGASYADLFRGGRAILSVLVILGAALHALQIMVIAIIMPTVVGDIGGASYFAWPAMIYSVGAILGAAGVGPVWERFGGRRGYAFSGLAVFAATIASAMAPDMGTLVAARAVQGAAGGLILGGSMALIGVLFDDALRTRILAIYQGTWMVVQLLGPLVGGAFAEIGWWRRSFWVTVRLDDPDFVGDIDFLKLDVQGSELMVLQNGIDVLSDVYLVQTEVEFVELYKGQPLFSDIDTFLRSEGFQFHTFQINGTRCYKPLVISDDINTGLNQLLWADAIYVKDNERLQQAPESKLIKAAILLNDLYMSLEFCHHLLAIADQMSGNEFAPAYLNYLIGETNQLNQLLAETSPG